MRTTAPNTSIAKVAKMLNKLHIRQFTKSRARHCNDKSWVS